LAAFSSHIIMCFYHLYIPGSLELSSTTTGDKMSLRLISLLLFALLYCCQSEELEEAALQNSSGLVRNQAIVFQNKEDSVFKVKSTTTRRNVRTTSTTEHSFALPSTSKPVNINHKNKRPSSQTTTTTRLPAPAEIISTTTEPVEKLKNDTADRIGDIFNLIPCGLGNFHIYYYYFCSKVHTFFYNYFQNKNPPTIRGILNSFLNAAMF